MSQKMREKKQQIQKTINSDLFGTFIQVRYVIRGQCVDNIYQTIDTYRLDVDSKSTIYTSRQKSNQKAF